MSDKIELTKSELKEKIDEAIAEKEAEWKEQKHNLHQENSKWRRIAQGKELDESQKESMIVSLEKERDELQEKYSKLAKKSESELKAATESIQKEQNFTRSLLVDNGLTAALTEAGVTNPALLKAAVALHKGSVTIEADGDNRVAKVGDKTLSDHLKEWAGSDEGKHFVSAQNNSGGGANGGNGGGASDVKGKVDGNPKERAAHFAGKFNLNSE